MTTTLEDQLATVANGHRRQLLLSLTEHNPQPVESAIDEAVGPADRRRNQRLEMVHIHLPRLRDDGFVYWEPGADHVTKGPFFDEIRPLLSLLDENEEILSCGSVG